MNPIRFGLQLGHQLDKMPERPSQPVKPPDRQHVARPEASYTLQCRAVHLAAHFDHVAWMINSHQTASGRMATCRPARWRVRGGGLLLRLERELKAGGMVPRWIHVTTIPPKNHGRRWSAFLRPARGGRPADVALHAGQVTGQVAGCRRMLCAEAHGRTWHSR